MATLPVGKSKQQGFTLVELLVVIAITAVSLALVGGLTADTIGKYKLKADKQKIATIVDRVSKEAFLTQQNLRLRFQNSQAVLFNQKSMKIAEFYFDVVTFEQQDFAFNRHGVLTSTELTVNNGGIYFRMDLNRG